MKPELQEQVGEAELLQLRRQRLGAWLRKCLKWTGLALCWVLWFYWSAGFCGGGVTLLLSKHPAWGTLCIAIGIISVLGGVYCSSPRFKSGDAKRSFADFKAWLRERPHAAWEATKNLFKWMVGLAVVGVCGVLVIDGYQGLDRAGWITHNHDTPVWIQGDWLVGEYRDCQMRTKTVPAQRKGLDSLGKLPRLFCAQDANGLFDFQRATALVSPPPDIQLPPSGAMYFFTVTGSELDHEFHAMPVRYYGRIDRQDKWVISWNCQRKNESLECKALN